MEPVVAAKVEDTAGAAQPSQAPPVEIEIVDTPTAAPETPEAPAVPPLFFGKYKSMEEAEEGLKNAQRMAHEKSEEAATYQRMLNERAAAPPTPQFQQPQGDFDGQFRERLAENPAAVIFEMTQFAANKAIEQQQKVQRELVKKYQSFASRPEYAGVAQRVASQLPFAQDNPVDPVEGVFLREQVAYLTAQLANGGANRQVNAPYVEPGGAARRTGANTMRVELDPDTARLRGMDQEKVRDLARMVARQKNAGGTMREMSIDDWEKTNA